MPSPLNIILAISALYTEVRATNSANSVLLPIPGVSFVNLIAGAAEDPLIVR